ncbi:MAG: hypothetical protein JSW73_02115 [Candidatus Woesearchaeota archaeon]|nr:MAG: hypothetical protein JSW73_02115 [Candidatus Woesearchaeota archaeon]
MRQSEVIKYYSRKEIGNELVRFAKNREVAAKFREGSFGKRPDTIQFPRDVISLAKDGAFSFHASEEHWSNPMQIKTDMRRVELDKLREGWDLVLDVDCKELEYSRICAQLLLDALEYHDVKSTSIKFSGGTGFHIGVPFEALPKQVRGNNTKDMFPEMPRIVAEYLKEFISTNLAQQILEKDEDLKKIGEKVGKTAKELLIKTNKGEEFSPYTFLEIDTLLISQRHLIRMPYSLHEKTGLVSLTINKKDFQNFKLDWAKPENAPVRDYFLNSEKVESEDATQLLVQAWDWKEKETKAEEKPKVIIPLEGKISEDKFPPCLKNILKGLEDGRKRSLFILINFLKRLNWSWEEIEKRVKEWNKKNAEPLKEGYIRSQINWYKKQGSTIPPPNCNVPNYYLDIGICKPDNLCKKIKNPLTYAAIRSKRKTYK